MWKLYNYKGSKYWVNEFGTVKSVALGKILQTRKNADGYLTVTVGTSKSVNRPQTRTTKSVHRIVAELFVPNSNPLIYTEVNHKDFNRQNCEASNLEWVTHAQNVDYSIANKRWFTQTHNCSGENNHNSHLTRQQVREIRKLAQDGVSLYRISKQYECGWTTVSHIVKRETWKEI